MAGAPPPGRSPLRRRWRWRTPKLHADPRTLIGLGLCALAVVVAVSPQPQSLEGVLRVSGLSFVLQSADGDGNAPAQGFLAVRLRSLTIKELEGGKALVVPLSGRRWPLGGNKSLSFRASGAQPMELRIRLPIGSRIATLQSEGKDEVLIDLIPPAISHRSEQPVELLIVPPTQPGAAAGSATAPLQAAYAVPARGEQSLKPPETEFSLPLAGATRLRLQRADPGVPLIFERNLRVKDVQFTRQRRSLFDQLPVTTSTLQSGNLRLGRQETMTLQADQFLQMEAPGIGVITSLRMEPAATAQDLAKAPDLLAVEVVGESTKIRSGLSLQHPTTVLQGTVLSRYFSPDQMSSFFGFLAGVISSLVLTCFDWE